MPQLQQQTIDMDSTTTSTATTLTSKVEALEISPVIVPSMSPVSDFPLYYYYYLQPQALPRPLSMPIHHTLENATISFDTMDYQVKWHKDLLVKDVFLSPPMASNTQHSMLHRLQQQQRQQSKKMEVAPSDLLMEDADVFGLDDTALLLDDHQHQPRIYPQYQQQQQQQQHHHQQHIYANDLPTPPAMMDSPCSDYLGMKRRHSSISSDGSSDDASSVQSDNEKRPCLVHSPCSLPESPSQLPMFDFDEDEDDEEAESQIDKRTFSSTDFQPYPTTMEWMTDDEDDMALYQQPLNLELNTNETKPGSLIPSKPAQKKSKKSASVKKQPKEKSAKSSSSSTTSKASGKKASSSLAPSSPSSSATLSKAAGDSNITDDGTPMPVYVPHGAPEVDLRYSSQGLYKHLLKQRVDWCRYCGTTEGVNWRPGPWGKRTLCNKHGCDYKGYGFACKLPRLDLTAFVKEPMDQRVRPVLQLFCSCCHRSESWQDNLLVQCDGCPMAYHQQCRRQQDLDDDFCASDEPFFCNGDKCRDNLKKKRVVVEFSRKRLPLMRTPKQQQQQQQALIDALK